MQGIAPISSEAAAGSNIWLRWMDWNTGLPGAASLALFLAGRRPDGRAPIIPTTNEWSSTLQKRPTAVVVIYSASILHIVEAFILAESKAADTSIPIASLLFCRWARTRHSGSR